MEIQPPVLSFFFFLHPSSLPSFLPSFFPSFLPYLAEGNFRISTTIGNYCAILL
jgi:hypothetical protein